jgi:hypothetical protein
VKLKPVLGNKKKIIKFIKDQNKKIKNKKRYDEWSYGYGNKNGNKFHKSLPEKYGEKYGFGSVIGCYIDMPALETLDLFLQPQNNVETQQNLEMQNEKKSEREIKLKGKIEGKDYLFVTVEKDKEW